MCSLPCASPVFDPKGPEVSDNCDQVNVVVARAPGDCSATSTAGDSSGSSAITGSNGYQSSSAPPSSQTSASTTAEIQSSTSITSNPAPTTSTTSDLSSSSAADINHSTSNPAPITGYSTGSLLSSSSAADINHSTSNPIPPMDINSSISNSVPPTDTHPGISNPTSTDIHPNIPDPTSADTQLPSASNGLTFPPTISNAPSTLLSDSAPQTAITTPSTTSTTSTIVITIPPTAIGPPLTTSVPTSSGLVVVHPITQQPLAFPTASYTGGPLLTGTCTIPQYTLVALPDGSLMEIPMIGCADIRPDCCPSLRPVAPPLSTVTVIAPIIESTEAVAALSADPLTQCPSDYTELGSVCCPNGFTLYSQELLGQTPCYTILTTTLPIPLGVTSELSLLASRLAQSPSSSSVTASYSVQIIANEVVALSLPHTPGSNNLSVPAQIGIGVGAGVGGLLILFILLWLVRRRIRRPTLSGNPAMSSSEPPSSSRYSGPSRPPPGPPQQDTQHWGFYPDGQRQSPSPPAVATPYGMIPQPPPQQHQDFTQEMRGELPVGSSHFVDSTHNYPVEMAGVRSPSPRIHRPFPIRNWHY